MGGCATRLTEWLLADNERVVGWIIDDGGLNEETIALGDFRLSCQELVAFGLTVVEETLDLFVLHLILNRAKHDALLITGPDKKLPSSFGHCLYEWLVDLLVDVDALRRYADLTRVHEGAHCDFGCDLFNVDVGQDN